jgi:predicted nucleic acid-binding protein
MNHLLDVTGLDIGLLSDADLHALTGKLCEADSALMRPQPIAITAMTEAEILHGIERLPAGRRQQALRQPWEELMADLFGGYSLPFSSEAAPWYGELVSRRERLARPISSADAVIAATTLAHGAQLATRNTADFEAIGLALINPWLGLAPSPERR